jgi:protein O-mannosyl-transferase
MRILMNLIDHKISAAAFLFIITFGVFSFSLGNGFVWDDYLVIKRPYSSGESGSITSKLMITNIRESGKKGIHYRPIFHTSLLIDYRNWGLSPFGYHLSSIIFYSISVVVFYFLALIVIGGFKLHGKEAIAIVSSLLFAVYPLHVEPVSWIAGRSDLLCGLFFFLAFIFHIYSYRRLGFLMLAGICFYLSLLSKEVAIVFPLVALMFDLVNRRLKRSSNILIYAVYAILLLLYLYVRQRAYITIPELPTVIETLPGSEGPPSGMMPSTEGIPPKIFDRFYHIFEPFLISYLLYIKKLVFPIHLNAFIGTVPKGFFHLISAIFIFLSLVFMSFASIRWKKGIVAFSIMWILITLGPASITAIFPLATTSLAERYLFIPSAGFCLLVGYLIFETGKIVKATRINLVLGAILFSIYLCITIERQSVWKDDVTLWEDTSKKSPFHAIPHANHGIALWQSGKTEEAVKELTIAFDLSLRGNNGVRARVATELGALYMDKKDLDKAEKWFTKSLDYRDKNFTAFYNLGLIYFIKGRDRNSLSDFKQAESYFKKALKIDKNNKELHILLSQLYSVGLEDPEKAMLHLRRGD